MMPRVKRLSGSSLPSTPAGTIRPGRRRRFRVLLSLVLAALAAGCSDDATEPPTRDEVAIFGYLYIGETVSVENAILVTRVRPVGEFYDPVEATVNDALVTLRRVGDAEPETLRAVGPGSYAAPDYPIEARATYDLSVAIPGDRTLHARTTTPFAFEAEGGPPGLPDSVPHTILQDAHPVYLACDDPEQIALVDVYCREDWEPARYIYPFGDREAPDDYAEYGGDNGEPRHISAYFRLNDLVRVGEGADERFVIDFYSAMMAFYGAYAVQVFTIDDNYYRFLYRDHPEEEGGIVGGIGVFGSACRRSWEIRVGRATSGPARGRLKSSEDPTRPSVGAAAFRTAVPPWAGN